MQTPLWFDYTTTTTNLAHGPSTGSGPLLMIFQDDSLSARHPEPVEGWLPG